MTSWTQPTRDEVELSLLKLPGPESASTLLLLPSAQPAMAPATKPETRVSSRFPPDRQGG